jgi:hypothetical protein
VFGNGSGEIIEPQFARAAAQRFKGVEVAAHEGFEALAVCELQVHLSAVALHQAKGVQFARRPVVGQGSEVSPIDIEALARGGFHPHVGSPQRRVLAHRLQVIFEDRDAAVITERLQPLKQDRRRRFGILFKQLRHGRLESIELAGSVATAGRRSWVVQILGQRVPADVEVTCDSTLGPLLDQVQTVDLVDLFWAEHRQPLYKHGGNKRP